MKFSFSIKLLSVLILAACAQQPVQKPQVSLPSVSVDNHAPEQGTGLTEQKLIRAKHYMAASANPLATEAGYEILKRDGSAIDAMIAMQTTLGLVEPQSSGLGGGAFLVYWDNKAKKLTTFDARETAPKAATPGLFLDENGKPMGFMKAVVGGRSVGVPGIPKLLEDVHKRYGKLPWQVCLRNRLLWRNKVLLFLRVWRNPSSKIWNPCNVIRKPPLTSCLTANLWLRERC